MYCTQCGNAIDEDAKFCPACGAAVQMQADAGDGNTAANAEAAAGALEEPTVQTPPEPAGDATANADGVAALAKPTAPAPPASIAEPGTPGATDPKKRASVQLKAVVGAGALVVVILLAVVIANAISPANKPLDTDTSLPAFTQTVEQQRDQGFIRIYDPQEGVQDVDSGSDT